MPISIYSASEKLRSHILDNFLRSPKEIVSVMADQGKLHILLYSISMFESLQIKGMYCYLYSASGCAGNMVGIPIGWLMNVADLGFAGMAKSIGGI
jgi:hypothetical protein